MTFFRISTSKYNEICKNIASLGPDNLKNVATFLSSKHDKKVANMILVCRMLNDCKLDDDNYYYVKFSYDKELLKYINPDKIIPKGIDDLVLISNMLSKPIIYKCDQEYGISDLINYLVD